MKKFIFPLVILLVTTQLVSAQKELLVKSGDKGLYLEHKVAAKESFYAIGRLYNVSPKYLATYNKLDINKGLQIDQKMRIPLTDTNFTQQGNVGTPLYYKVGEKEGLLTVSNKNNKVTLANLRLWNNISGSEIKENDKLVIGFLHSNGMPAITLKNKPVQDDAVAVEEKKATEPVKEKEVKKEEEKEAKAEEKAAEKMSEQQEKSKPAPVVVKEVIAPVSSGQGYFKPHFEQQVKGTPVTKNETVTSGIFKTTSGWQDAKYYVLIDKVSPGTIVKIINPGNNNVIYAKVLGEMSGIRQNEGLNIRISNAASSALGITEDDKFIVKVNY